MRESLEIIYFISGPIVAIAACIGLYQLILTKRTAETSAKRDSFTLAAQQCEFYLNKVIPLHHILDEAAKRVGLKSYGEAKIKRTDGKVQISIKQDPSITDKCIEIGNEFVAAMNATESFSGFFTNCIAADLPAYECVGKTFCSTVEDLLPELAPLAKRGYYKNTMKLYLIWSARLEKQQLEKEKIQLENKTKSIVDFEFKSLGT